MMFARSEPLVKVLFVCSDNTCRSPMAEAVMNYFVKLEGLECTVDSAGLSSCKVGRSPEDRCIKVLAEHGIQTNHLGRQLRENDYNTFDYILAMDESDLEEIRLRSPERINPEKEIRADIELFGSYLPLSREQSIKDPCSEPGMAGFYRCYNDVLMLVKQFIILLEYGGIDE